MLLLLLMLIPHLHPHLYENMRKGDKVQDHLMIHRPAHIKASPGKKKIESKYSCSGGNEILSKFTLWWSQVWWWRYALGMAFLTTQYSLSGNLHGKVFMDHKTASDLSAHCFIWLPRRKQPVQVQTSDWLPLAQLKYFPDFPNVTYLKSFQSFKLDQWNK